jgi:hypothetical protein
MLAAQKTVQRDASAGRTIGGCTSFVAKNADSTLHARTVDYWGMGYWQKHALLMYVDPRDPGGNPDGYRYLSIADVGELWAGTSGVNDKGLVVTTHLHVSRDIAPLDGRLTMSGLQLALRMATSPARPEVSVYRYVETMLRRAASVDEAVAIAQSMRPVGSWSFIVSDPTGAHAIVDATPRDLKVHRDETVATNFYLDAGMRSLEAFPSRGPIEGARLRYKRAHELVDPRATRMTVACATATTSPPRRRARSLRTASRRSTPRSPSWWRRRPNTPRASGSPNRMVTATRPRPSPPSLRSTGRRGSMRRVARRGACRGNALGSTPRSTASPPNPTPRR